MRGDPKLTIAVLCDYVSVSNEGKFNLNGIFKLIRGKLPILYPVMFIAANFRVSEVGQYKVRVDLIKTADKSVVSSLNFEINLTMIPDSKETVIVGQFVNIVFSEAGAYEANIYWENEPIEKIPFQVIANG
jgi:hypothetical protein